MSSLRIPLLLSGLLLAAALPAGAWTAEMRVRIVDESVRFMPPSLRLALEKQREPLLRGMLEPLTAGELAERRPPWAGGTLDVALEREARELDALLAAPGDFTRVARGFGELAHLVLEASFPPAMTDPYPRARAEHFASFCAERLEKFPLLFLGHEDEALDRGDFRAFALRTARQARDEDVLLAGAYAAAGDPPHPSHFDDRSVPFAVASLSYSRAVNHVVRAWLASWKAAGGDMGRTPYLHPTPTDKADEATRDG